MNKKIIIIAIIVVVVIIAAVVIFKPKENEKESLEGNQITREEFNNNLIENTEEKLSNAGIEVMKGTETRFKGLGGNEYIVMENGEETEKTLEMYPINLKEKREMLGENAQNGKVTIDEETQGILSGNVLIVNISDESLMNKIINALDL